MPLSKFHIDTLSAIIGCFKQHSFLLEQIPFLTINNIEHTVVDCYYAYPVISNFAQRI
jgi:hypothetical protein